MRYIEPCLNSALTQDYHNYDVHAYDNGSTDGTLEYIRELEQKHAHLTVHEVPNVYKNSYREAHDHAFQNIETDYITYLASDDYLDTKYLSKCMRVILHDPEKIKCIQSGIISVDENGAFRNKSTHSYKNINDFKQQCMLRSPVNTPTMIYHKSLYSLMNWAPYGGEAHKHHKVQEAGAGDYDMFCGFADNDVFIYPVNTCFGYYYRWHPEQCTWQVINEKKIFNYDEMIQNYWKKKWNL